MMAKFELAFSFLCSDFATKFIENAPPTGEPADVTKAGALMYLANIMDEILQKAGGQNNHQPGTAIGSMRALYMQLTMGLEVPDFNYLIGEYIDNPEV